MNEEDLWGPSAPTWVGEGDVVSFSGKPLLLRTIIQRAWGWPKKAAYEGADVVVKDAREKGRRPMVALDDRHRVEQQRSIILSRPRVMDHLLTGLAHDMSRERYDAGHEISEVNIHFLEPIADSGFTRALLRSLANRLGCTLDEAREAIHFNTATSAVQLRVDTTSFDLRSTGERKAG